MNLCIDMYELGARDRIHVRHLEGLAVMQLVPAQMQFVGDIFGDEIRTCTTVNKCSNIGFPDLQVDIERWIYDIYFTSARVLRRVLAQGGIGGRRRLVDGVSRFCSKLVVSILLDCSPFGG